MDVSENVLIFVKKSHNLDVEVAMYMSCEVIAQAELTEYEREHLLAEAALSL